MAFIARTSKDDAEISATALTNTAGPLLIHSLILGARSDYLAVEKTRKLNFAR